METSFNFQTQCWELVKFLEPWLWWIKSASAGLCFGLMFFQLWTVPWYMKIARYLSMVGMVLIALAGGNTALGPLGDFVFWPTYMIFQLMWVIRLMPALRAHMASQPPFPEKVILTYAFKGVVPINRALVK